MDELARCEHAVVVRTLRARDVVREYWRLLRGRPGLRPDECTGALVCRRCGATVPEGGSSRSRPPLVWLGLGLLAAAGCSTGLQERAFKDESGTYIVSRSLVNDRVTANQPHLVGVFACNHRISDLDLAAFSQIDPVQRSQYTSCEPIEKYRPGGYQLTSDQPIFTIYKGPMEAAILGGSVGAGLAMSGDTVTQQGGGASASARSKSVSGRTGRRQ